MKNLRLPDFRATENRRKGLAAAVGCACALLLGGSSALAQSLSGSSLAISGSATVGNLSVTGTGDFWGNNLSFGTSSLLSTGSSSVPGVEFTFVNGTPSLLKSTAFQSTHEWLWEHATNGQNPTVPMMRLDSNHVLTIYNLAANPAFVLNPAAGSLEITGSSSQVTLNGSPLLTASTAAQLYVSQSNVSVTPGLYDSTISIGGSNGSLPGGTLVIGNYCSVAENPNIVGSADGSIAIGKYCTTGSPDGSFISGLGAWNGVAIGESCQATGPKSIAIGSGATASGWVSTAIGYSANASAFGATAIGNWANATADNAVAMGSNTDAAGANQFVIGRSNLKQGDPGQWVPSDDLFIIGNGGDSWVLYQDGTWGPYRSNAFVVKKNGDTQIYGGLTLAGTTGAILTGTGNVEITGTLAITGSSSQVTLNGSPLLTMSAAQLLFGNASNLVSQDGYGTICLGTSNNAACGAVVIGSNCAGGNAAGGWLPGLGVWGGVAIGDYSQATGAKSIAVGSGATASGWFSTAIGYYANASARDSIAIGANTDAAGACQFVIGQYNLQQGTDWDWVPTDDLFIIGNGTDTDHRSNAFSVKKNGDTSINGNTTINGNLNINGLLSINDQQVALGGGSCPWTVSGSLVTLGTGSNGSNVVSFNRDNGSASLANQKVVVGADGSLAVANNGVTIDKDSNVATQGQLTVSGTAKFRSAVLVPEQGDISMGEFTAGDQPQ